MFLLVAIATFPLVVPFLVFSELEPALLASRLVALGDAFPRRLDCSRAMPAATVDRWGSAWRRSARCCIGALMALGG